MFIYFLIWLCLTIYKINLLYFLIFFYFIQCVQIRAYYSNLLYPDRANINLTKRLNFKKYLFVNNNINYKNCKSFKNHREYFTHNSGAVQVDELQQIQVSELNKLNDHSINKIHALSRVLYDKSLNRSDFINQLVTIGREVYLDSPNNFLFQKLPNKVNLLKEFDTNDLFNNNRDHRDYFIVKSPVCVKYKLLRDCSFFIYFSVFVDENKSLYVDGTSESLIYRGIISILISIINSLAFNADTGNNIGSIFSTNHYISDALSSNEFIKKLLDLNIINKITLDLIINHIQTEINNQIFPNTTATLYKNITNEKVRDVTHKTDINDVKYNILSKTSQKKVAVLLSGGVDSSLSLWILKNTGYYVEAFYLQVNDIHNDTGTCKSDDLKYAGEVCKKIGVKLNVLPFSKLYYDDILKDFIEDYKNGEVPNPDVWCNNKIKFGQFLDRALNWGFDYVASGHYASVVQDKSLNSDRPVKRLVVSKDSIKDQTYFLSKLNQFQLSKLIFPLEHLTKQKVREYAKNIGLPSFNKDDSVGLCFLEDLKISEYLLNKLGKNNGPIVDYKTNQIIGEHLGLFNYSIGQRKNLNNYIFTKCSPNTLRYVIKKDLHNNVLYVTEDYDSSEYTEAGGIRSSFKITDIFFNTPDYVELLNKCQLEDNVMAHGDSYRLKVKLRHSPKFYDSITHLYYSKNNETIDDKNWRVGVPTNNVSDSTNGISSRILDKYDSGIVYLNEPDSGISTGQYCVFYLDNFCLGSAKMITNY